MDFEEIWDKIVECLIPKLEKNEGLYIFARRRAKFEGWLKVELCEMLYKNNDISVETVVNNGKRIDITFTDWAVEIKTANTSYKYENVEWVNESLSYNVKSIIKDIEKLKETNYNNKGILFIVFPCETNNKYWKKHIEKIKKHIEKINKQFELNFKDFKFQKDIPGKEIPGIVYFVKISNPMKM